MVKLMIYSCFALLVVHLLLPCEGFQSRNKGNERGYYGVDHPKTYMGTSAGIPSQNSTRRGLGLSAWGIVMLVVGLILACMGVYYFSICYPILCKKERKYDIMKSDTV